MPRFARAACPERCKEDRAALSFSVSMRAGNVSQVQGGPDQHSAPSAFQQIVGSLRVKKMPQGLVILIAEAGANSHMLGDRP
jgi:hypothetical protein